MHAIKTKNFNLKKKKNAWTMRITPKLSMREHKICVIRKTGTIHTTRNRKGTNHIVTYTFVQFAEIFYINL